MTPARKTLDVAHTGPNGGGDQRADAPDGEQTLDDRIVASQLRQAGLDRVHRDLQALGLIQNLRVDLPHLCGQRCPAFSQGSLESWQVVSKSPGDQGTQLAQGASQETGPRIPRAFVLLA